MPTMNEANARSTTSPSRDVSAAPRDRLPSIALILANLIPLVGVALLHWDAFDLISLYWFENLVIGFYTLGKILLVSHSAPGRPASLKARAATALFFLVHYGIFCGAHGLLLVSVLSPGSGSPLMTSDTLLAGPLLFVGLWVPVARYLWALNPHETMMVFVALMISHGVSFVQNSLTGQEREQMTLKTAMAAPYPRILVMHATVLLGGLLVEAMHSPVAMLILLVALKTYVDFRLHRKERHRSARPLPMTPAEGAASP